MCRHLERCNKRCLLDYKAAQKGTQAATTANQPQLNLHSFATSTNNTENCNNAASVYSRVSVKHKTITDSIVRNLIIGCGLPPSIVANDNFKKFLFDLDPRYQPVCRQTITKSLIPKLVEEEKQLLQLKLKECKFISLTVDCWTDRRSHAFVGVTSHMYQNGISSSNLLAFKSLPGSHTGVKIADAIDNIVDEFDIKQNVYNIVTDNASNMLKAMTIYFPSDDDNCDQMADLQHSEVDDVTLWQECEETVVGEICGEVCKQRIACFCHSLQLVVRDGLAKLNYCRAAIAKVTKIANICHQSAVFRAAYEDIVGKDKVVPTATATRWNSNYLQLQVICELDSVKLNEVLRVTNHENCILSTKELNVLQELVVILQPFAEATDLTQSESAVSISCVVPVVLSLSKFLSEHATAVRYHGSFVAELLKQMHNRFHHLYVLLNIPCQLSGDTKPLMFNDKIFLLASAIDPRYAFHWLVDHPGLQETKDSLRHNITGLCIDLCLIFLNILFNI